MDEGGPPGRGGRGGRGRGGFRDGPEYNGHRNRCVFDQALRCV